MKIHIEYRAEYNLIDVFLYLTNDDGTRSLSPFACDKFRARWWQGWSLNKSVYDRAIRWANRQALLMHENHERMIK